ncbi:hypothetical protein HPP92_028268 [Vanilla planifolia]|uniref:Uncharacterized protein n=1 Tax=Vanilla planifolia TaxID=51239 RepID=A0A835P8N5_VANPL|nr:hypothetical protein HPP92_028268 [Vanilla planifolia]
MQEGVEVALRLTTWSRIWRKCNLIQAAIIAEPFLFEKFLTGVFSFLEISMSSPLLTVLSGQFLFHDHNKHRDLAHP